MPIYLKTNDGNIALKTGGVPQSQINELLISQEARLEAEHVKEIEGINEAHATEINNINTEHAEQIEEINEIHEAEVDALNITIAGLSAEIDGLEEDVEELQAIVADYPTPVEGVEF